MTISAMDEASARAILDWRYPSPYSFYDAMTENTDDALAEMLDGSHAAVHDEDGALIGFLAFGSTAQVPGGWAADAYTEDALDLGLGLRPDLTGRGFGQVFVEGALAHAADIYGAGLIRLSVATFNSRAITVYQRAGFRPGLTFRSTTPAGETEFLTMTTVVSDSSQTATARRSSAP